MTVLGQTSFIYAHQSWFWILFTVILLIAILIGMPLWIIHSINVCQDLFTSERQSIDWRKKKPIINKSYRIMTLLSYLSITMYLCIGIPQSLSSYKYFKDYCLELIEISTYLYFIAKQCMYFLFLCRLYVIYNGSSFEYKPRFLFMIGAISMLLCISNFIIVKFYTEIDLIFYADIPIAMHCNPYYPLMIYFIFGINDIFMTLFFLYSFVKPIRLLVKKSESSENDQYLIKLVSKSVIVTLVAVLSTLAFTVVLLQTTTLLFGIFDIFINFFCMMLMTPYYNEKYYERLCCVLVILVNRCVGLDKKSKMNPSEQIRKTTRSGSTVAQDSTMNSKSKNEATEGDDVIV